MPRAAETMAVCGPDPSIPTRQGHGVLVRSRATPSSGVQPPSARDVRGSLPVQRWMLGPEGWTMPVCEVATVVGQSYRYEWAAEDGSATFGITGELLESEPPSAECQHREHDRHGRPRLRHGGWDGEL